MRRYTCLTCDVMIETGDDAPAPPQCAACGTSPAKWSPWIVADPCAVCNGVGHVTAPWRLCAHCGGDGTEPEKPSYETPPEESIARSIASLDRECGMCKHFHGAHQRCTAFLGDQSGNFCSCESWR